MSSVGALRLYDTMSREIQTMAPMDGQTFRFHCCGPTVYGPAHIGNFRTFVLQDTFRRVLELTGIKTKHVRNVTDVDDKTIAHSQAEGLSLHEFTQKWTDRFHADCELLNLLRPHVEPGAVGHMEQQIEMIQKLVQDGYAYQAEDGSVYFRVSAYQDYGRLSRLSEREIRHGAGQTALAADEYEKDSVADFALWKARKPEDGENYWESPWGQGRPGWHIECSAMSVYHLGPEFDLHSGGVDLMFPHHENEIAQSVCSTSKSFSKYWFHIAHLLVDGSKMSKSLGNLFTLEQLAKMGHHPMAVRYLLVSGHYRGPLNFTLANLEGAESALSRLIRFEDRLKDRLGEVQDLSYEELQEVEYLGPFEEAWEELLDDLNTPAALGKVFAAIKEVNCEELVRVRELTDLLRAFQKTMAAFGLDLNALRDQPKEEVPSDILELATERWQSKKNKDFARADAIRKELTEKGWQVVDQRDGFEVLPL